MLAASLERRTSAYVAALLPPAGDGRSPREQILHVFEQVESQAGAPEVRGCSYLAVQIELKDQSHPASQVAHRVKGNLTAFSTPRLNRVARAIRTCWPGSSACSSTAPAPARASGPTR